MAATQAGLAADMLSLGRSLDMWSLGFAALAGVGLLMAVLMHDLMQQRMLSADLLLALVQRYYALRTGLDAAIFRRWAENWRSLDGCDVEQNLQAFDAGLGKETATCRPLSDRISGARRLLLRQAFWFAVQVICFLIAMRLT